MADSTTEPTITLKVSLLRSYLEGLQKNLPLAVPTFVEDCMADLAKGAIVPDPDEGLGTNIALSRLAGSMMLAGIGCELDDGSTADCDD